MKEIKLPCAEANLALASWNCGHFTSPLFQESNNMFSVEIENRECDFKVYSKSDRTWLAGWNNWKRSIDDLSVWIQRNVDNGVIDTTSNENYIRSLEASSMFANKSHLEKGVLHVYDRLFLDWSKVFADPLIGISKGEQSKNYL